MMEYTTLVWKECGHFGLIKNKLPHEIVTCSQCELEGKKSRVRVQQSKILVGREVPALDFQEMEQWIRQHFSIIERT